MLRKLLQQKPLEISHCILVKLFSLRREMGCRPRLIVNLLFSVSM